MLAILSEIYWLLLGVASLSISLDMSLAAAASFDSSDSSVRNHRLFIF